MTEVASERGGGSSVANVVRWGLGKDEDGGSRWYCVVSTLVQGERLSVIFLNATGLCGFPRQLHTCNGRAKKPPHTVIDGSEDDRGRASSAESVQMPAGQGGTRAERRTDGGALRNGCKARNELHGFSSEKVREVAGDKNRRNEQPLDERIKT